MSIAKQGKHILPEFTMDHLGTSFDVVLVHSAWEDGQDIVIPDEFGLHKAIARQRALDSRKVTGGDIRYLRKSLGLKGKDLASALDISPEYLSRCEAGEKVMSSQVEKMLRLIVLSEIARVAEKAAEITRRPVPAATVAKWMHDVRQVISCMKIKPVSCVGERIVYRLQHTPLPRTSPAAIESTLPAAARDEWDRTQLEYAHA